MHIQSKNWTCLFLRRNTRTQARETGYACKSSNSLTYRQNLSIHKRLLLTYVQKYVVRVYVGSELHLSFIPRIMRMHTRIIMREDISHFPPYKTHLEKKNHPASYTRMVELSLTDSHLNMTHAQRHAHMHKGTRAYTYAGTIFLINPELARS